VAQLSPTQRTLNALWDRDCIAEVVEKWIPKQKLRLDLFGFIDVLAVDPGRQGCLGIQVTTGSHAATRRKKILSPPCRAAAKVWLLAGNRIQVWGWRNLKKDGWAPRILPILLVDIAEVE
jgi:hypothetical protein